MLLVFQYIILTCFLLIQVQIIFCLLYVTFKVLYITVVCSVEDMQYLTWRFVILKFIVVRLIIWLQGYKHALVLLDDPLELYEGFK